ncbi:hypothetical protein [Taklimakanibacter albus]|uniref:Uncharacterized protein n=1 Tax=Taklimakanibacter albus TaxID=2800327 RepID=A0ACC5RG34_9HYPH|nr:hypothetical protein [Aestuariivirga sp. YIM B02566]MBK1871572.1 hypothetical protein [Aestuariivirga sp. YIM B02566]
MTFIFNRNRPLLCLLAGLFLCGLKWPFNWFGGQDANRKAAMQASSFGLLHPASPLLINAWDRLEGKVPDNDGEYGRTTHNLTNLAIEWTRVWTPYATKYIASFGVYLIVLMIAAMSLAVYFEL